MATYRGSAAYADADRVRVVTTLALVVGIVFLAIGLAGFLATGFDDIAEPTGETLLGFGVNPLHNLVHLAFGVAGVLMWRTLGSARTYGWIVAIGYGATLAYGLVVDQRDDANILNINGADNLLHAILLIAGLAIALWPVRERGIARGVGDEG